MTETHEVTEFEVGDTLELTPDAVAHGGSFVARAGGRVFFVRHTAIGETVLAKITGTGPKKRFFFADAIGVKTPSEHRREHPWPLADAGLRENPVGGMEFGHLTPQYQRELKAQVIQEQLVRLGKVSENSALLKLLRVEALEPSDLGWRTRVYFNVADGKISMFRHSSSERVQVQDFPLADSRINSLQLHRLNLENIKRVDVAVSSTGQVLVSFAVVAPATPRQVADDVEKQCEQLWGNLKKQNISLVFAAERKGGRRRGERPESAVRGAGFTELTEELSVGDESLEWNVSAGGFWQIHRSAPEALTAAVAEMADLNAGETVYDLYAGTGLFTAVAAAEVGGKGRVLSVEGSPLTSANARDNFVSGRARLADSKDTVIDVVKSDVGAHLHKLVSQVQAGKSPAPDAVIMDPSREGVGKKVIESLTALAPKRIVYVACDPAALGRDTGYLREHGWELKDVQAFDMYPNTHHVETVALFAHPE